MKSSVNIIDVTVWAMLLSLALLWGGSFIFVELALRDFQALTIVAFRVGIGALVLHIIVRLKNLTVPIDRTSVLQFAVMGALNNAVPFTLIVWGQQTIDAGRASILNATVPLFTVVIAHYLLADEKLTPAKILGVIIGFAGVVVLAGSGEPGAATGNSGIGQMAVLGASISYAFAAIYGRQLNRFEPLVSACGMLSASTVIMLPLAFLFESGLRVQAGMLPIISVVALGSACTALAYLLYFKILTRAGSSNLSLVTFLIPPGAIMMGVMFLNEQVTVNEIIGLLLIMTGMSFATGVYRIFFRRRDQ